MLNLDELVLTVLNAKSKDRGEKVEILLAQYPEFISQALQQYLDSLKSNGTLQSHFNAIVLLDEFIFKKFTDLNEGMKYKWMNKGFEYAHQYIVSLRTTPSDNGYWKKQTQLVNYFAKYQRLFRCEKMMIQSVLENRNLDEQYLLNTPKIITCMVKDFVRLGLALAFVKNLPKAEKSLQFASKAYQILESNIEQWNLFFNKNLVDVMSKLKRNMTVLQQMINYYHIYNQFGNHPYLPFPDGFEAKFAILIMNCEQMENLFNMNLDELQRISKIEFPLTKKLHELKASRKDSLDDWAESEYQPAIVPQMQAVRTRSKSDPLKPLVMNDNASQSQRTNKFP